MYSHCPLLQRMWFVTNGGIYMGCADDTSCFLFVMRLPNEICCLLVVILPNTVVSR